MSKINKLQCKLCFEILCSFFLALEKHTFALNLEKYVKNLYLNLNWNSGLTALGNTTLTPTTRISTTAATTGAVNTEGLTSTIAATTAKPTQSVVEESSKSSKITPSQVSKAEEFHENDKTQVFEWTKNDCWLIELSLTCFHWL